MLVHVDVKYRVLILLCPYLSALHGLFQVTTGRARLAVIYILLQSGSTPLKSIEASGVSVCFYLSYLKVLDSISFISHVSFASTNTLLITGLLLKTRYYMLSTIFLIAFNTRIVTTHFYPLT
jgi:hypothetical protein